MELFLSGESTLRQINKEFQKRFPFLKLEFYKYRNTTGENSYWKDKFSGQITLKEMGGKLISAVIKIDPLEFSFSKLNIHELPFVLSGFF